MPLQGSGQISFTNIAGELGITSTNASLRSMSSIAGKTTPDFMSDFYGYDHTVLLNYFIVAGGGGGGRSNYGSSGGGGGGGYKTGTNLLLTKGIPYPLRVGKGGAGAASINIASVNGENSVFHTLTATGGGRGAAGGPTNDAGNGGSGGGGATWRSNFVDYYQPPGSGTPGEGFSGGAPEGTVYGPGGGGGGGGEVGGDGANGLPGKGGDGVYFNSGDDADYIGGYLVGLYYAGGGAAGAGSSSGQALGGIGGGGRGAPSAQSGLAGRGGGGGAGEGNSSAAASGGSGVIYLFIPVAVTPTFSAGVTFTNLGASPYAGKNTYKITAAGASDTVTF